MGLFGNIGNAVGNIGSAVAKGAGKPRPAPHGEAGATSGARAAPVHYTSAPQTGHTDVTTAGPNYGLNAANRFKRTPQFKRAAGAAAIAGAQYHAARATSARDTQAALQLIAQARKRYGSEAVPKGVELSIPQFADVGVKHSDGIGGPILGAISSAGPIGLASKEINAVTGIDPYNIALKAAAGTAKAFYDNPIPTTVHTARGLRDTVVATLAGVPKIIADTGQALGGDPGPLGKDAQALGNVYSKTYGGLAHGQSISDFAKQVAKDPQGATQQILDATALLGTAGATTGRLLGKVAADTGAIDNLAGAGRVGTFLKGAAQPRPDLKLGLGLVREQATHPNYFKAMAGHAVDLRRASKEQARIQKAIATGRATRKVVPGQGEVAPLFRATPVFHQARDVAAIRARNAIGLANTRHRIITKQAAPLIRNLSKDERTGLYFVVNGITPANAVTHGAEIRSALLDYRHAIESHRLVNNVQPALNDAKNIETINHLLSGDNIAKSFTPELQTAWRAFQPIDVGVADLAHGLGDVVAAKRRLAPAADRLGLRQGERTVAAAPGVVPELAHFDESDAAYIQRVEQAMTAAGLEKPGYFYHAPLNPRSFDTSGLGEHGIGPAIHKSELKLLHEGRVNTDATQYLVGLDRTLRRHYKWEQTASMLESHTEPWARNKPIAAIMRGVEERGLDPKRFALVNLGAFRQTAESALAPDAGRRFGAEGRSAADLANEGHAGRVLGALDDAKKGDLEAVLANLQRPGGAQLAQEPGWSLIDKTALNETRSGLKESNPVARAWDVGKNAQSRLLLGGLGTNIPWLSYQILSNGVLAGFAIKGRIDRFIGAQRWWHALSEPEKAEVEPYLKIVHGYGESASNMHQAPSDIGMVNGYRAFKQTDMHRSLTAARKVNPVTAIFRADKENNAFFRRTVMYDRVKADRTNEMAQALGNAAKEQGNVVGALTKTPEERLKWMQSPEGQKSLQRYGASVDKVLGDYVTYTRLERRFLARYIMFYGFLRYSLRLLFYTLPVHHPILASVTAHLGQMQKDEVDQILGGPELPQAYGRLYFDGGKTAVDLSRANPALDTITQAQHLSQIAGVLPPAAQEVLDQMVTQSTFTGDGWKVHGENTPRAHGYGFFQGYPLDDRARIALADATNLLFPLRSYSQFANPGPQGSDSLPWDPRPTKYKRSDVVSSINADVARSKHENQDVLLTVARALAPFAVPHPSFDVKIAASRRQQIAQAAAKRAHKSISTGGSSNGLSGGGLGGGGLGSSLGGGGL